MAHEVLDKTLPDFWRGVRPGSVIKLTDEQTLLRNMDGIDYTVQRVETVMESGGLMEWILLRLESVSGESLPDGRDDEPMIMVKIVDANMDLRVYREAGDFDQGDRVDMEECDNLWLFFEPDDPDDFDVRDLRYTEYIEYEVDGDDDGDEKVVRFEQKHPEQNGEVATEPSGSGSSPMMAVVSEYSAVDDDYKDSEAVIIEIGSDDAMEERGGLISFMLGHTINPTETEVLTA